MNHETTSMRPVDIHAHFFPQVYLDVLAEEGPRFYVEYRAAKEGFYIKTEVRFQGPLSYHIVDLKKRIADMGAQGTAVQAMSLTGPMAHWGDEEISHKMARAWNNGASATHSGTRGSLKEGTVPAPRLMLQCKSNRVCIRKGNSVGQAAN